MRRIHVMLALVLIGCVALPVVSEAKKKKKRAPEELVALVERVTTSRGNFFIRNTFDTDPSSYLGRFVPEGTDPANIDDSMSMQTQCSQHISYKYVGGGGVQYDDYFNASTDVSASFGVPMLNNTLTSMGAEVGYSGGSVVRVRYTLTGKMVANIEDPDAFAECCEEAPGRCTGVFLGEFLEGQGELYHVDADNTGVKAGIGIKGAEAGVDVRDGVSWARSITFPNPVYFAFKTTAVPPGLIQTFEECGGWQTTIPESNRGLYFVGLSDIVPSQKMAREVARKDARVQVVQYLGEQIQAGSLEIRTTTGDLGNLQAMMDSEDFVQSAAEGVARHVKDRSYCIKTHETPDGVKYEAATLSFLPNTAAQAAAEEITGGEEEAEEGGEEGGE